MIGAMKLQPDDGPRSSLCIGPGYKRCNGISPKGLGSSLGTRWEIAGRTPEDSPQECRTLPDRREQRVNCPGRWVNRSGRWVNRPYPDFSDTIRFWLRF
ncbi:hypothetical protein B296_00031741 [Ensete ventricosum]|uniref:Uncharacterized protein n=1 Tax=Ensete ventricosum TaxID=4639 RepID=A0A426X6A7_ENSVE|nr:hypothetical protein B296_00031741 [Ensete ventricosum]